MKKSEQLFYLIKSLTKSEKRSFKLFAKIYSKEKGNNYTILFDELDKMKSYNHDLLINIINQKTTTTSTSRLKNQLSEVIMRSLLLSSSVSTDGIEINTAINYITILFVKGLNDQANELIIRTKENALKQKDYLAIERLSVLEYYIAMQGANTDRMDTYINSISKILEVSRIQNKQAADLELTLLKMRAYYLKNNSVNYSADSGHLEMIMNSPCIQESSEGLDLYSLVSYHAVWGYYYHLKGDGESTYYHRKEVLNIFRPQRGTPPTTWIVHARLLLISLSTFQLHEEFKIELKFIQEELRKFPKEIISEFVKNILKLTLANIQLHEYILNAKFKDALLQIEDTESLMKHSIEFVDANLQMTLRSNFSMIYFGVGEYKKALHHLNDILNNKEMSHIRVDTQCYNLVKNLLIHYSLGNYSLVQSLIFSTRNFFIKQNRMNPYIDSFLKFAKKNLLDNYDKSKEQSFEDQITQLDSILIEFKWGTQVLNYFNFKIWLKSIILQCTMNDVDEREK